VRRKNVSLITRVNTGTQKGAIASYSGSLLQSGIPVFSGLLAIQNIILDYFSVGKLLAT
jgi:hypothetical protein